ncbi:SRPBCC family protein [Nocardioides jensenii]|uniref:SRPBCC family protein n=1 Tax=Nocardioides jensenii TaxID=1843 RepID=UPI0008365E1B|nr:SRPBCC family protein [Nocardioides jensenii]
MRGSVTVHMQAAPDRVWALVSDVTRIGEFSPETFEAEWTDGATGPALGAHFRGHVKRNGVGPVYWTNCKVTSCEVGTDFGFAVYAGGQRANNWRYQLRERDGGTEVTESFELGGHPALRVYGLVIGPLRRRTNLRGMRQTLERIKAVVEA